MTAVSWLPDLVLLPLPANVVAVWRVPMETQRPLTAAEWETLSGEERARAERFRFDEPRIRLVRCRRALRMILGRWLDVAPAALTFEYGVHGKPYLINTVNAPAFNVSHSHDWAVIAVTAAGDLGIDVERRDPRTSWPGMARRFFAPQEAEVLFALSLERQLESFYQIWTGKEAFIKAIGRGLSFPLSAFCVEADPQRPRALLAVDDTQLAAQPWQMANVDPGAGYAASVIWNGPASLVICGDFDPFSERPI